MTADHPPPPSDAAVYYLYCELRNHNYVKVHGAKTWSECLKHIETYAYDERWIITTINTTHHYLEYPPPISIYGGKSITYSSGKRVKG